MKKYIFIVMCISLPCLLQAQMVGINTTSPQANLDVNGSVRLTKQLFLGGDDTTDGDPGKVGQVVVSQGSSLPPIWASLDFSPLQTGEYVLASSHIAEDQNGIVLDINDNTVTGYPYAEGQAQDAIHGGISGGGGVFNGAYWKTFNDTKYTFPASSKKRRAVVSFQTQALTKDGVNRNIQSFAIGVFQKDGTGTSKLKYVRPYILRGWHEPIMLCTIICILEDIPTGKNVEICVAAIGRTRSYSEDLHLGAPIPGNKLGDDFIVKSVLRIDVYEKMN